MSLTLDEGYYNNNQAAGFGNSRLRSMSISYRALMSVLSSVKSFVDSLAGKNVRILSDNITCVAYINRLGGSSQDLTVTKQLWLLSQETGFTLITR